MEVIAVRLDEHEAAVYRALWATPQLTGIPSDSVVAHVVRHHDGLVVTVTVPPNLGETLHEVVAERALRAVQGFDRSTDKIEVTVLTSP